MYEKLETLQRMYGLINVFATQQFRRSKLSHFCASRSVTPSMC